MTDTFRDLVRQMRLAQRRCRKAVEAYNHGYDTKKRDELWHVLMEARDERDRLVAAVDREIGLLESE